MLAVNKNTNLYPLHFRKSLLLIIFSIVFITEAQYSINEGIIEISDTQKDQIDLKGNWGFINGKFISPDKLNDTILRSSDKLKVPGVWTPGNKGAGTYLLKIKGLNNIHSPVLRIEEIRSSYKLYFKSISSNDDKPKLLAQCGEPSINESKSSALFKEIFCRLPAGSDSGYIVIHVSNYKVLNGGIKFPIYLGEFETIKKTRDFERAINFTIIGIVLFMAFHHLFLFFNLREKTTYLFFSIFSIFMGSYTFLNQGYAFEHIISPNENLFINALKLVYLCLIFGFPFFLSFLTRVFYHEFSKTFEKFFWIVSSLFLIGLFLPIYIFEKLFLYYHLFLLSMILYSTFCILKAMQNQRSASKISFVGFLIFLLTVIHDILLDHMIIDSNIWLGAYGMVAFILSQSAVLSRLFAETHRNLEYLSRNLEIEVTKKTEDLRSAHQELALEVEARTNVFVNLAHEIKTPLAIINTNLQNISETPQKEEIEEIKFNVNMLISQVHNFLDSEKIRRGNIEYDHSNPLDISLFLTKKIPGFKNLANTKNIKLSANIENNLFCKIDPHAFNRITNNLIDNAIKYNCPEGSINIEINGNNNNILLIVKNTGIGIEPNKLQEIFEPYKQVSSEKKNSEGLGMGLYIIKGIIDSIDGKISVKSKLQESTTFTISLKKSKPSYNVSQFPDQILTIPSDMSINEKIEDFISEEKRETILLVEDNRSLLKSLKKSLMDEFNILIAENGKRALQKLKKIKLTPSLIISDIMMDEMDGITFQKELTIQQKLCDIPFIFLTAKSGEAEEIYGLESGAVDYITKPFSILILKAKIRTLLNFNSLKNSIIESEKFRSIGILTSTISHEIMNPLMGINGPLDILKNCIENDNITNTDTVKEAIGYISNNLKRIEDIIQTLKSINNKVEIKEEINLLCFLQPILKLFRENSRDRIEIITNIPEYFTFISNGSALSQIFINLLSNAADAIEDNGKIFISVNEEDKTITIADTGKGIEKIYLDKIFNFSFTTKDQSKGTGVGLFIVKQLCEQMGMNIAVESEFGKGSKFYLKY